MGTREKFGCAMQEGRMLDLDQVDDHLADRLSQKVPSWRSCIKCAACVATCPVGVGLLKLSSLRQCLLCGKCQLVCPRGIPTRLVVIDLMNEYHERAAVI